MLTIKNFGNNCDCANETQLLNALKTRYAGQSVAVHDKRTGFTKVHFVDVSKTGSIAHSHTNKPFSLSA